MKDLTPKSKRTFSKRVVTINLVLTWALMFASLYFQQAEFAIPAGFALIGTLFGIYAGVGHLDFRNAVKLSIDQLMKGASRE